MYLDLIWIVSTKDSNEPNQTLTNLFKATRPIGRVQYRFYSSCHIFYSSYFLLMKYHFQTTEWWWSRNYVSVECAYFRDRCTFMCFQLTASNHFPAGSKLVNVKKIKEEINLERINYLASESLEQTLVHFPYPNVMHFRPFYPCTRR